jgi:hypothetical protein
MSQLIRLACTSCDTDEGDGITEIPAGWSDVQEVQSLEASREPVEAGDSSRSPFAWYTHLGICPDCKAQQDPLPPE